MLPVRGDAGEWEDRQSPGRSPFNCRGFGLSMLTLRPTGLSPPIYRDQLDYEVLEDGLPIGRLPVQAPTKYEFQSILRQLRRSA